jgi:hypothetical protein
MCVLIPLNNCLQYIPDTFEDEADDFVDAGEGGGTVMSSSSSMLAASLSTAIFSRKQATT